MTSQPQETSMREEPISLMVWVRQDLSTRFNGVVRETLPQDMLDLLAGHTGPD